MSVPPALLCGAMLFSASILSPGSVIHLTFSYIVGMVSFVVTSILLWMFWKFSFLACQRADRPLSIVFSELQSKLSLLWLPLFVLPLFLAGFTAAKIAIPDLVGFRFDRVLADLDRIIFSTDPWKITHVVIGELGSHIIQFFYVTVWIAALGYSTALIVLFADRRMIGTFYTAMLLTWFMGGFLAAYLLPAAGPVFVHLADPEMGGRFVPLKNQLAISLPPEAAFLSGPAYLEFGLRSGTPLAGGGISAMPSMHIGATAIYVLASRGTRWFVPACAFAAVIFVGSIHSGYHYAVDAPVAVLIAWVSWRVSQKIYREVQLVSDRALVWSIR